MKQPHKALFTTSIILNVLFIGAILGNLLPSLLPAPLFSQTTTQLIAKLPDNKRALFESTMQPAIQQVNEARRHINEAKAEALRLLKAEPFNVEAYMTQTQHIVDLHTQMKHHMAEAVTGLASKFSHEERLILADIILSLPPAAGSPTQLNDPSSCNQATPH